MKYDKEINLRGLIHESFINSLNTSNTKIDLETQNSTSFNKFNNFRKALNLVKKLKLDEINVKPVITDFTPNNTTTEYDRNISEHSYSNANHSREENLINFSRHPLEKTVHIYNNNVIKKKRTVQTMTSANIPMELSIKKINPLLNTKIIEVEDEDEEEKISDGLNKLNKSISRGRNSVNIQEENLPSNYICKIDDKKIYINSKNKCSTTYDSNDNNKIEEKIEPVTKQIQKFELDDLDEVKDINLVDYQIEGMSSAINKKMNISDLEMFNLDINFDISQDYNYNNENIKNNKINKNSKILIIDSVLNSNDSNNSIITQNQKFSKMSAADDLHLNTESTNFLKKKLINLKMKKKLPQSLHNSANKFYRLHSNSTMKNLNKTQEVINPEQEEDLEHDQGLQHQQLNTTQKSQRRVRKKYYKTEIFDSNLKLQENQEETNTGITNRKKNVKKNLISKFNQAEAEDEFIIEQIDLITENDNSYGVGYICNSEVVITGYSQNNYYNNSNNNSKILDYNIFTTPLNKIRNSNTINDLTITKIRKSSFVSNKSFRFDIENSVHSQAEAEEKSFIDTVFDLEFINNLLAREFHYRADPNYLTRHPRLEVMYRSILVEWIMELCEEFAFKRDTFHYSVNYIDRFLSFYNDISKRSLQLIGVTSLSIAAKFEEIQIPKIEDYIHSTDNTYTGEEITATEKLILKTLKWEIMPTTINTWLNWYLCQWDLYIDAVSEVKEKLKCVNKDPIYFKKPDEQCYMYYRQVAQLIDLYTVDYYSLSHTSRHLVAATLFIVISRIYEVQPFLSFNINKFDFDNNFFLNFLQDTNNTIIDIFSDFLQQSFNFSLIDESLIKALVYVSKFLSYEFNYNLPLVLQSNPDGFDNVRITLFIFS